MYKLNTESVSNLFEKPRVSVLLFSLIEMKACEHAVLSEKKWLLFSRIKTFTFCMWSLETLRGFSFD